LSLDKRALIRVRPWKFFHTPKRSIAIYDAKQKAAFKAAVEELVAEGLVEKHDDTVILTAKRQRGDFLTRSPNPSSGNP
jgi:hypothetical protein